MIPRFFFRADLALGWVLSVANATPRETPAVRVTGTGISEMQTSREEINLISSLFKKFHCS